MCNKYFIKSSASRIVFERKLAVIVQKHGLVSISSLAALSTYLLFLSHQS